MIYKTTKRFPREEVFGLTSQLRRAAVSITSNFFSTSLGSLTEVQNQLLVAKDIEYLPKEEFTPIAHQTIKVSKLLNGLLKHCRSFL